MAPPSSPQPDLDGILAIIHAEATRRGGAVALPLDAHRARPATVAWQRPALEGTFTHVRDFLALGSEGMLDAAYRQLLQRPPDAHGLATYRHALRTGRRTKAEVLGRIRFSAEGRRQGAHVRGLVGAFVLALGYRIPVVGAILDGAAALARVPLHLRDRRLIEYAAHEAAAERER